jgi:hypothetical protein
VSIGVSGGKAGDSECWWLLADLAGQPCCLQRWNRPGAYGKGEVMQSLRRPATP